MSVRVFAPAKINLTLKVGRPRTDGYHPLQSVVAFADVGDIVEAEESDTLSLDIHGDFAEGLSAGADNLVVRAAHALAEAAGVAPRARLSLEKNLPIASGIGGGSSDAASTLLALNSLWTLDWPAQRLAELGAKLGADVPVFFSGGGAAFMTGAGERFTRVRAPSFAAALVNPLQPLSTPGVYSAFDRMGLGAHLNDDAPPPSWSTGAEALAAMRALGNDLEAAASALMPAVSHVLAELRGIEGVSYAALSGSGATVFAIVENAARAEQLADDLINRHPDWWVQDATLGA
jgi:4-diphosphocytidyl-2-C-methyl-D-erythritol kinase